MVQQDKLLTARAMIASWLRARDRAREQHRNAAPLPPSGKTWAETAQSYEDRIKGAREAIRILTA
jgi:hypothetical protein